MKHFISALFCAFVLLACIAQPALAANKVSDISVAVVLSDDGSAYITQTWNCNFTEGTECYIPIENLGEMSLTGFLVSDISGAYTYIEDWDIDAGFAEKAGKCGIIGTDGGYELCWGISEYGERRYAIEYQITGFVGGFSDFDGFNFQFINPGMGTLPTDVTVALTARDGISLDADNCGIWAFGFDGQIEFQNGQVVAYTETPLSSDTDSVIIMLQLNKGLLHPTRVVDESFEAVKAQALENSDYDYDAPGDDSSAIQPEEEYGPYDLLVGLITFVIPIAVVLFFLVRRVTRKKKLRSLYKNADYFREAPVAGNMEAAFVLANDFHQADDDGNLIGAAFLKLLSAGCLEPMSEKTVGFFGREKESISLRLVHPPQFAGITTKMLYDLLVLASGSDQILQERELESYCKKNHTALMRIIKVAKKDGSTTLVQIDCYDASKKAKPLGLSPRGVDLLLSIMGFKKYLLDFSLIGERSIAESLIWQDYLTFATLFGIADKAIEQFKKVYPEATEYGENAYYYYLLAHRYSSASYGAAQSARSSGKGGHSSFGGGGGFSGGGMGGGTR